ncbi:MAG TPA: hypothetical protein VI756_08815 [Blastocatellia bacterium]
MDAVSQRITADQIIAALDKLSQDELEEVSQRALAVQAGRRAPHLPAAESALLEKASQGMPAQMRSRFRDLQRKRDLGSISDS